MLYIKQIQAMFNVSFEEAEKIMDGMCLDFSEASHEEFEREAKHAYAWLKEQEPDWGLLWNDTSAELN